MLIHYITLLQDATEKIKSMLNWQKENARQNHNTKTGDKLFENMSKLKRLGITQTNQIACMKELRADYTWIMPVTFRFKILILCYLKHQDQNI
jgi:hypothetical protein